jgi:murein DD-endopeptidase MepM/ murein hydrolase activator NlpD
MGNARRLLMVAIALAGSLCLSACGGVATPVAEVAPTAAPTLMPTTAPTAAPSATPIPATATQESTEVPTTSPTKAATTTPATTQTPTVLPAPTAAPSPAASGHVFPVKAKRYSISSSHHDYPAADIACPIGSTFVAVTSGVVDYVNRVDIWKAATNNPADKGGISVAIVGDDGVRYYGSHLSEVAQGIEPGVRVEAGQELGLTGESGNAKGVYPQLHFGISHPTTPDDWAIRRGEFWPQKYLKAWARGEDVTPPTIKN